MDSFTSTHHHQYIRLESLEQPKKGDGRRRRKRTKLNQLIDDEAQNIIFEEIKECIDNVTFEMINYENIDKHLQQTVNCPIGCERPSDHWQILFLISIAINTILAIVISTFVLQLSIRVGDLLAINNRLDHDINCPLTQ